MVSKQKNEVEEGDPSHQGAERTGASGSGQQNVRLGLERHEVVRTHLALTSTTAAYIQRSDLFCIIILRVFVVVSRPVITDRADRIRTTTTHPISQSAS